MSPRLAILVLTLVLLPRAALLAEQPALCCGRGGVPQGERPALPLEERASPWSGDLIVAFDEGRERPARGLVEGAVGAVRGVTRVESDVEGRFLRVWLEPGAAAITPVLQELEMRGAPGVPAVMSPLRFDRAGEKGRILAVEGALRRAPGVVTFEVEVEGEQAVARVWHRPGADLPRLVTVLATIGIGAWLPLAGTASAAE